MLLAAVFCGGQHNVIVIARRGISMDSWDWVGHRGACAERGGVAFSQNISQVALMKRNLRGLD